VLSGDEGEGEWEGVTMCLQSFRVPPISSTSFLAAVKDKLRLFPCENPCEKNSPKPAKTGKNWKKRGKQKTMISNT
jgi:hypothetical protein